MTLVQAAAGECSVVATNAVLADGAPDFMSPLSPSFQWKSSSTPLTSQAFLLGALSMYFLVALFFERYMATRATPISWVASYAKAHNVFLAAGSAVAADPQYLLELLSVE